VKLGDLFKNLESFSKKNLNNIDIVVSSFSKADENMAKYLLSKKLLVLFKENVENFKFVGLPVVEKKLVIFRSPHVHKKAKDHYRSRTYKFILKIQFQCDKDHNVKFEQLLVKSLESNMPKSVSFCLNIQTNNL